MLSRFIFLRVLAALAPCASPVLAQESFDYDVKFGSTVLSETGTSLSIGDRIVIHDRLLQAGEEVGAAHGVCTITDPAGFALCTITFVLPDGVISTQFVNSPPPEKFFSIMGGTGAFAGAAGTGRLWEHGDGTGVLSFELKE